MCWDTYFEVIECVDWNKFVWIKVLFLDSHNISYLLYLSSTGMHFGDTWNKCPTLCLFCLSITFDVLVDHRKNLLIQMCRVELQVGLSISKLFCYRPTSSFVIIFYAVIICNIYVYFPFPFPNWLVFTLFSHLVTFCEKLWLLRVVLEIFWGRGLATLLMGHIYCLTCITLWCVLSSFWLDAF